MQREKALKAEQERQRHRLALNKALREQKRKVIRETIAAKQAKLNSLQQANEQREAEEDEKLQKVELVKQKIEEGKARM